MTSNATQPSVILIAGHWLGAWAWDEVVEHLTSAGLQAIPLTLPGLDAADSDRTLRTLADQASAIEAAIAGEGRPVVIVAHSGANAPVSVVLDRHPELVARVIWVDSGPVASGTVFAPDLPDDVTELPLPPFEGLGAQASLDGLSTAMLERFRARAVPEPAPILRQPVELDNDARMQVPTTLLCCSLPSTQVMDLANAGYPMFAEVARLTDVRLVDLATGHWPMWSRPADLARALAAEVAA